MKNLLRTLLFSITLAALAACGKPSSIAGRSEAESVLVVLRAQTDALNREDANAMLATIDPSSPAYGPTRTMSEQLFKAYDLRYTIKDMKVENLAADTAQVRVHQMTEKINGPNFRNNVMEAVHTFKKRNGQWKLFGTQVVKTDYLDK